jgi:Na+-driven multidrug efflux pump
MGVKGIWWAISLSSLFKGIGLLLLFYFLKIKTDDFKKLKFIATKKRSKTY